MRLFVTIDIGGTAIKYGIIDENGVLLNSSERPTEANKGGMAIMDKVKDIIYGYINKYSLSGICISTAGMVCPKEGKILHSGPTIPNYKGVEIKKIMEEEFNIPCFVENDVNSAALGEMWLGSGKSKSSMVCVTIGTGIGGAVIIDGKILSGFSNSAGEIGYTIVNGKQIQDLSSTTALVKNVAARKNISYKDVNGKIIIKGYEDGDIICIEEIEKMVDYLCIQLSNIAYILNPELIILGGGIMKREDIFRPLIDKYLQKYLIESVLKNTKIEFASLENTAGMTGALYNFLQRE